MKQEQAGTRELWSRRSLLLGSFLGLATGVSSLYFYTTGLFLKPLAIEFGWSRGMASLGPLVAILSIGFVAPLIGKLVDRFGARRIALISILGFALSFLALALFTRGLWTFLALTFALAVLANGTSPVTYARIVVEAISNKLGFALGLVYSGTGLGALVAPWIVAQAIKHFGWRDAYMSLAGFTLCMLPVIALLLRGKDVPPESAAPAETNDWHLFADRRFLILAAIFLFCSTGIFGTIVHFVPMLTDRGVAPTAAAGLAGLLGFAVIAGRLLTGFLLDRFDSSRLAAVIFTGSAVGILLLASGRSELILPATLMTGFTIGTEFDLAAYMIGRRFPVAHFSTLFGGIYAAVSIGGGGGPLFAGIIYDATGSYIVWFTFAVVVILLAAVLCLFTRPPAARRS